MKKYLVEVKVWDVALVEVEAENQDQAEDKALDFNDERADWIDGGREVLNVEELEED